jgi:formiminoglutamase
MSYQKISPISGRIDGSSADALRWHQVLKYIDLNSEILLSKNNKGHVANQHLQNAEPLIHIDSMLAKSVKNVDLQQSHKGIVFLGFATDEGVRRNQGRIGASGGHESITKVMANFPVHFDNTDLFHGGVIECEDGNLEKAQAELAFYVEKILSAGCLPIVLGGGHDVTYGHYSGIKNFIRRGEKSYRKVGIINIDAHLDLRPIDKNIGATSGTSIWQIATESKKNNEPFDCLALGIQRYGNTKLLFNLADEFGVKYILGDDFNYEKKDFILNKIEEFIDSVDFVYLTICMDVFAASHAPGVSATSFNGIIPDHIFMSCFDKIIKSKKFTGIDFAEVNPKFDVDFRTAKLAASMIFRLL